jgi:CDP-diacylglycerol---serine O-phosphatidyltransferase
LRGDAYGLAMRLSGKWPCGAGELRMGRNRKKRLGNERFRRSIYVLPNLFTALNMLCGFYAVVAAIDGNFIASAYAVLVACIFDTLDGKIARATNTTSKFGVEFDSLADLISFGLAPGILMYLWVLTPLGRIGWLAAFLFLACGALRLARFNTQAATISSEFFIGLPIPAAAGMSAVTILFCQKVGVVEQVHPFVFLAMLYVLSFLMVSTIKYHSLKKMDLLRNKNFNVLVSAILVLILIAAQPSFTLFFMAAAYLISGPVMILHHHRIAGKQIVETAPEKDQGSSPV